MNLQELTEAIQGCDAIVLNMDGTVLEGTMPGYRSAASLGRNFLRREMERALWKPAKNRVEHMGNVLMGLANYRRVRGVAEGRREYLGMTGEAAGLKYLFDVLAMTGCADIESARRFAMDIAARHICMGADEFLRVSEKPAFLTTLGCDLVADEVGQRLGIGSGRVYSNVVHSDGKGIITGCELTYSDNDRSRKVNNVMRDREGFNIENCAYIGDSTLDSTFMEAARVSLLRAHPRMTDAEVAKLRRKIGKVDYAFRFYADLL